MPLFGSSDEEKVEITGGQIQPDKEKKPQPQDLTGRALGASVETQVKLSTLSQGLSYIILNLENVVESVRDFQEALDAVKSKL